MSHVTRCRRRTGMTLIELMLALTILSLVLGSVVMAAQRGADAYRRTTANSVLDAKAARTMNRLVRELVGLRRGTLVPVNLAPPFGSRNLEFQRAVGYAGRVVTWGSTTRLDIETDAGERDNGVDDDGDGLVDECAVVLLRDFGEAEQKRVVLARGVAEFLDGETDNGDDDNGNGLLDERGLSFDLVGDTLTVRISVERIGPDGERMVRTLETSIGLRNE